MGGPAEARRRGLRAYLRRGWARVVEPSAGITDGEERRRARLLLSLLAPLCVAGVLLSAFAPVLSEGLPPFGHPSSWMGLGTSLLVAGGYFLARTRHHQLAASSVVAVVTAGIWGSYIAARADPNSGFILSFLAIGLLLSGMMLPVSATLALCALDIIGVAILPFLIPGVEPGFVLIPALFVGMIAFLVAVSSAASAAESKDRRRAEERLRHEEERYRNLVESSPDGIVLVAGGRIVYGNRSAARLFGARETRELIGLSPLGDLVAPDHVAVIEKRMQAIEQEGARTAPLEIQVKRLDGSILDVEVMGAPAMHEGMPADQTIVRDITARKEAEDARRRIERLEEVNAMKTQLLNMASHELNTPIAALRLQLHMLKLGPQEQDPKRAKALVVLDRNVERLATLVKDVLDVAKMQSGQLKVRLEPTTLKPIVEEAAELYAQSYLEKGVSLAVDGEDVPVRADAQRITQVLVNVLSNALKFTPSGGEVRVHVAQADGRAIVRVKDTGPGLSPEQIARLFQPFSQVHDQSVETKGGTGLGLHISRGILDQHGGRIWCESEGPGRGTTFAFEMPVAREEGGGRRAEGEGGAEAEAEA